MSETKPLVQNDDDMEMLRRLKAYQPTAFFVTFGGYFMARPERVTPPSSNSSNPRVVTLPQFFLQWTQFSWLHMPLEM